jgi:peptide/nickel transport system substrate-binding protein
VRTTKRSKFAALAVGLALVVAACGEDDDSSSDTASGDTEAPSEDTEAPTDDTGAPTTDTGGGTGDAAMRVTYDIAEEAVWNDGSPIVADDFVCTYNAVMNTVGSLSTVGYDQILTIAAGESDKQVVIDFKTVYAPYRGLFSALIKHDAVADCNDISGDLQTDFPFSNRPYQLDSWSESQLILVPNPNWFGDAPVVDKVVMVPKADAETEINALLAGEVDFIYPQYSPEISDAVAGDANVKVGLVFGGDYEGLYFQQQEGPFADPVYRQAFAQSIDVDAFMAQIYAPIVEGAEQLTCGPIVPGPYCDESTFTDTFDAEGAAALLEGDGWTMNGDGMWEKDGNVPEVRWMINSGNSRRENAQAYLIPLLQEAGFNVVADNCEADCVFQQRLPNLDYDLGMYISTAPPDPQYLTSSFACDQIPSEENNFAGQNSQGWCNEEATALLYQADATVDFDERAALIQQAIGFMREDWVMLPTFQFPKSGLYRLDRLAPEATVEQDFVNYQAFINFDQWEDVDGDGQIIIGAEQWPGCLNPLTECSNSSWYQWTVGFPLLMGVYDTTSEGTYELTPMMASEPVVEVLG